MVFRAYPIWYPLIVGSPLALIALAFTGYVFTATAFSYLFLLTRSSRLHRELTD
jgi:potassium efflux system protein